MHRPAKRLKSVLSAAVSVVDDLSAVDTDGAGADASMAVVGTASVPAYSLLAELTATKATRIRTALVNQMPARWTPDDLQVSARGARRRAQDAVQTRRAGGPVAVRRNYRQSSTGA